MSPTVLAIDDSPEVLTVLMARLRPEGVRVITATNWERGLALAVEEIPDLILLDVCMPEQNGFDMCRRLKADPRTASIPVIFVTAKDDVDTKIHGFDLGAVDYVTKPFHPDELRARVRGALRLKRERDGLRREARHDALTTLHNRAAFDELLVAEIRSSSASGAPLSLILLDLDHFKSINDRYGHAFGDRVLRSVSRELAANVRRTDFACRYGGEELVVILPGVSRQVALDLAERLRAKVASIELLIDNAPVRISASFGVASRTEDFPTRNLEDPDMLIAAADAALYLAKLEGRNCVRSYIAVSKPTSKASAPVVPVDVGDPANANDLARSA